MSNVSHDMQVFLHQRHCHHRRTMSGMQCSACSVVCRELMSLHSPHTWKPTSQHSLNIENANYSRSIHCSAEGSGYARGCCSECGWGKSSLGEEVAGTVGPWSECGGTWTRGERPSPPKFPGFISVHRKPEQIFTNHHRQTSSSIGTFLFRWSLNSRKINSWQTLCFIRRFKLIILWTAMVRAVVTSGPA